MKRKLVVALKEVARHHGAEVITIQVRTDDHNLYQQGHTMFRKKLCLRFLGDAPGAGATGVGTFAVKSESGSGGAGKKRKAGGGGAEEERGDVDDDGEREEADDGQWRGDPFWEFGMRRQWRAAIMASTPYNGISANGLASVFGMDTKSVREFKKWAEKNKTCYLSCQIRMVGKNRQGFFTASPPPGTVWQGSELPPPPPWLAPEDDDDGSSGGRATKRAQVDAGDGTGGAGAAEGEDFGEWRARQLLGFLRDRGIQTSAELRDLLMEREGSNRDNRKIDTRTIARLLITLAEAGEVELYAKESLVPPPLPGGAEQQQQQGKDATPSPPLPLRPVVLPPSTKCNTGDLAGPARQSAEQVTMQLAAAKERQACRSRKMEQDATSKAKAKSQRNLKQHVRRNKEGWPCSEENILSDMSGARIAAARILHLFLWRVAFVGSPWGALATNVTGAQRPKTEAAAAVEGGGGAGRGGGCSSKSAADAAGAGAAAAGSVTGDQQPQQQLSEAEIELRARRAGAEAKQKALDAGMKMLTAQRAGWRVAARLRRYPVLGMPMPGGGIDRIFDMERALLQIPVAVIFQLFGFPASASDDNASADVDYNWKVAVRSMARQNTILGNAKEVVKSELRRKPDAPRHPRWFEGPLRRNIDILCRLGLLVPVDDGGGGGGGGKGKSKFGGSSDGGDNPFAVMGLGRYRIAGAAAMPVERSEANVAAARVLVEGAMGLGR
ncbi:unnamed protein product, partial [Phaeothamnion confervicola]